MIIKLTKLNPRYHLNVFHKEKRSPHKKSDNNHSKKRVPNKNRLTIFFHMICVDKFIKKLIKFISYLSFFLLKYYISNRKNYGFWISFLNKYLIYYSKKIFSFFLIYFIKIGDLEKIRQIKMRKSKIGQSIF